MPDQLPVWFFTMSEPWAPRLVAAMFIGGIVLVATLPFWRLK